MSKFLSLLFWSVLFSTNAFAVCNPEFLARPLTLPTAATESADINLRSLLKDPNNGELLDWDFFGSPTPPSWLQLDKTNEKFKLTPPLAAVGTHEFNLGVQCRGGEESDTTRVILQVQVVPKWKNAPNELFLGEIAAGENFSFDLREHITTADNNVNSLTFTATGLNQSNTDWLTLQANGILSGTPENSDVGNFRNIQFTAFHPSGGSSKTFANGVVTETLVAPKWNQKPISLPTAKEGQLYSRDLRPFVDHVETNPLTFEKTSGPAWVSVNAQSGLLSGTPGPNDISPKVSVGLRVYFISGGTTFEDSTVAEFAVANDNQPPHWITNPIRLPDASTTILYTQNLKNSVVDPDGDPLSFRILDGPGWANLSDEGKFEGTPAHSDKGTNEWTAEVTDGTHKVRATLIVEVDKTNEPPVWTSTKLPDATEDALYSRSLLPLVNDADGDKLTFTLLSVSGRNWITISEDGEIRGTPGVQEVGDNIIKVRVSDGQPGHNVVADLKLFVIHVNHEPYWVLDPIRLSGKEDVLFSEDISRFAHEKDVNDTLIFSKISGDNWISVSAAGMMTGTPGKLQVGENRFGVRVTDSAGASKDCTIIINVTHTNHAPKWTADPVQLPNAKEDSLYSEDLTTFVRDPDDGDTFSFTVLSDKPEWLNVTTAGIVTGIPRKKDLGDYSFKVRVFDQGSLFADTTVKVTVVKVNKPPRWTQAIINLPDTPEQTPFQFDLSDFAEDPDGDRLTFTMANGPGWMQVDINGMATGTPKDTDVGDHTAVFEVSDGQFSAQVEGKIRVLDVNQRPTFQQNPIKLSVKARDTLIEELNQAKYIKDPDGDILSFQVKNAKDWMTLASNGRLTAIPKASHIGKHTFNISASDGEFSVQGSVEITVEATQDPPIWLEDPIRLNASVGSLFSESLVRFAKDRNGLPLTFSAVGNSQWLTVEADGDISGTPTASNSGENTFTVRTANQFGHVDATLIITVGDDNRPPIWLENPITLDSAKAGLSYSASVAALAKDLDGDALTFTKVPNSGADWAVVTSTGQVVGNPTSQDLGLHTFTVRVTDTKQASADATVRVTVNNNGGGNRPPQWTQIPLQLGNAQVGQTYQKDISQFATDPDGDSLTFHPVNIPGWMTLRTDGLILGVPRPGDVGPYTAEFRVSDGQLSANVNASGQVSSSSNGAPIWDLEALSFVVRAGTPFDVNVNNANFVTDPDGDPMTFSMTTSPPPDWVTMGSNGDLGIRARQEHVNSEGHRFLVRATDSFQNFTDATLTIRVLPNQNLKPPIWLQKPLALSVVVGQQFNIDISDQARDPNDPPQTLSFFKENNPSWITLSTAGTLSGFPQSSQIGEHRFQATVSNSVGSDTNTIILTVKDDKPNQDNFIIDKPVPNAPAEVLWVVDNSWNWWWIFKDRMIRDLQSGIQAFYDELNSAQVRHTSVFISTDAHGDGGLPVEDDNKRLQLRWDDSQWVRSFANFVDNIRVPRCYNSPLWSMHLFYQKVPNLWEIYQNGYMEPGVPMDAMIVTKQLDQYKRFAQSPPESTWGPNDYADSFIKFHKGEQKSYRASAIAAQCPKLVDPWEQPAMVGPEDAYQQVAIRTGGDYYPWSCDSGMESYLRDFAQKIKRRAFIHANRRFTLSKTPSDVTKIVVKLGTMILDGNPGPAAQWRYDSFNNQVLIFWHNIDLSQVPAGARLTIEYPASG